MSASFDAEAPRSSGQSAGLLSALRRHPVVMIVTVIVFGILGVAATLVLPTNYTAEAKVVLGDQNDVRIFRSVPSLNATVKAQNAAQIMRSDPVYARASELLDGRLSADGVKGAVTVAPGTAANPLVTITVNESSATLSRDTANAEAQAYLDISQAQTAQRAAKSSQTLKASQDTAQTQLTTVVKSAAQRNREVAATASGITDTTARLRFVQNALSDDSEYQALQAQATALRTSINQIKEKIQETTIDSALVGSGVDTVYKASKPDDPRKADLKRNVAIALALGLLIGAGLAWRRLDRERAVVDHDQVSWILGAPMLAKMSRTRDLTLARGVADLSIGRRFGDDLRVLASGILLDMRRHGLSATVITSAAPGEGKSVLALNLAAAAKSAGFDVVLVDGDVRSAGLTRRFGLEKAPGLLDLLAGDSAVAGLDAVDLVPRTDLPIIPVGGRHLAAAPRTALPALQRQDSSAPVAFVDAPTLFEDPATFTLATGAVGLIIVVSRATTIEDLRTIRARVDLVGAPITGYIVNDYRPSRRAKGKHAHDRRSAARKAARAREQGRESDDDEFTGPSVAPGASEPLAPTLDLFDDAAHGPDHRSADQTDVFDQTEPDHPVDRSEVPGPDATDHLDAADGTVVDPSAQPPHTSDGSTTDHTDEVGADADDADTQPANTRSADRAAARNGKRGGTRQAARRRGVRAK